MRIAIYGKGGIGKSTIVSNLSALIGARNNSVLQVGCDPKHDSTLLLLQEEATTVLSSYLNHISEESIVKKGYNGVDCIEIGGPSPGVGCAGRGIIKGLEIIKQLGVLDKAYNYVFYDILGDVVCGGFFEPLKGGFVDRMYIVSSGEFNSLFAANNLCRGYRNCGLGERGIVLGGVIGNCRGIENEELLLDEFCKRINVPLVTLIPRDNRIEKSTFYRKPLISTQDTDLLGPFKKIVESIEDGAYGTKSPNYLELSELRELSQFFYS